MEQLVLRIEQERARGGDRHIKVFTVGSSGYGADLSYLLELVSRGELDPQIGWRGNWQQAADAADALIERRVRGKVVLDIFRNE